MISLSWFSLEETLLACQIGVSLIEAIWQVARARYLGADAGSLRLFDEPDYGSFVRMPRKGSRGSAQFDLPYYKDEADDTTANPAESAPKTGG